MLASKLPAQITGGGRAHTEKSSNVELLLPLFVSPLTLNLERWNGRSASRGVAAVRDVPDVTVEKMAVYARHRLFS